MQAIVTGMRECAENRLVQERGLKLVMDTCLALESFAEVGTRRSAGAPSVHDIRSLGLEIEVSSHPLQGLGRVDWRNTLYYRWNRDAEADNGLPVFTCFHLRFDPIYEVVLLRRKVVRTTEYPIFASPQAFVGAGVLETIVDGMDRFRQEWHLQACSCETISAIMAALPGNNRQLLVRVLEVGAHRAVGRASRW